MKIPVLLAFLALPAFADNCRVLVDGCGCRTRQLAIATIFEKLPGVEDVIILARSDAPAANQRYFLIKSKFKAPCLDQLVEALGKRAKHYHVISVEPASAPFINSGADRKSVV